MNFSLEDVKDAGHVDTLPVEEIEEAGDFWCLEGWDFSMVNEPEYVKSDDGAEEAAWQEKVRLRRRCGKRRLQLVDEAIVPTCADATKPVEKRQVSVANWY